MSDAEWPASLPIAPVANMQGGPIFSRISFEPDVGPPIERRRSTASVSTYAVTLTPFTRAQLDILEAWFAGELEGGTRRFVWRNPITKKLGYWKILPGDPDFQVAPIDDNLVRISFKAMLLPSVPWFAAYVPEGTAIVPSLVLDFETGKYGA